MSELTTATRDVVTRSAGGRCPQIGQPNMKIKRHSLIVPTMLFSIVPVTAFAIEQAWEAIATREYVDNMRTKTLMDKIDVNGDHIVSMEEGEAYFTKIFDALDRNGDGVLDKREWIGASHDKEVVSLSTGGYARALSSMEMMRKTDSDSDHLVTKAEFLTLHLRMFQKMAGGASSIDAAHWLADYFPH